MRVGKVNRGGGDEIEAFAARTVALHTHLVRVVLAVTGDADVADDAAQEALVRLWEREQRGIRLDDERTWATRVALNWARSGFRRRAAERRALQRLDGQRAHPGHTPDRSAEAVLSADIRSLLLGLPPRQREVAVLHYLADLDLAAIATITGTSVSAVKNALFHARRSLADGIEPANHRDVTPTGASARPEPTKGRS